MTLSLRDVICCASWSGRFHSVTISRECVSICNPNANWSNEDGRRWQWYTTDISKLTKWKLYWMLNNCKRTRMERNFIKDNLMGIMYAHRNKSHWWMLLVTKINAFPFYWLSRHKSHFVLFIWGTLQGLNQCVCVWSTKDVHHTQVGNHLVHILKDDRNHLDPYFRSEHNWYATISFICFVQCTMFDVYVTGICSY